MLFSYLNQSISHKLCAILIFTFALWGYSPNANSFETPAKQVIAIDMQSGVTLFEKAGSERMYPASMTKMMTAYLIFESLKNGTYTEKSTFTVSENAWKKGGSKTFVELGNKITIADLMRGIIIQSGNDACIVVAEGMAGSEKEFAKLMNAKAKKLGMNNTQFQNSTGWPDEEHYTTGKDLAILAQRLIIDFPEYYSIFGEKDFTYHNIKQPNRNLLLDRNIGVDGLKTGHTEISGYGETVSAINSKGRRIIVVVNGLSSIKERADEAEKAVNYAMGLFQNKLIAKAGVPLKRLKVQDGKVDSVTLVVKQDKYATLYKAGLDDISYKLNYRKPLIAPISKGQHIATLVVKSPELPAQEIKLIANEEIEEAGFFGKLWQSIKRFFSGDDDESLPINKVSTNSKETPNLPESTPELTTENELIVEPLIEKNDE